MSFELIDHILLLHSTEQESRQGLSASFLDSYATVPNMSLPEERAVVVGSSNSSVSSSQWATMVQAHRPQWTRGSPSSFINSVTFPQVLTDKPYTYRVIKGDQDLGIRPSYEVQPGGSQTVNLLEYNEGYGVPERIPVKVLAVDPEDQGETLVAQWGQNHH